MNDSTDTAKMGIYQLEGITATPGIMTYEQGKLSFKTAKHEVFSADLSLLRITFSTHATIRVTIGSTTYKFVTGTYAGGYPKEFNKEQLEELTGQPITDELLRKNRTGVSLYITSNVATNLAAAVGNTAGRTVGIFGQAVGVYRMFRAQKQSFEFSKAWVEYLRSKGANVEYKGTTYGKSQLTVAAIVIPSFIIMSVLITVIVFATSGR